MAAEYTDWDLVERVRGGDDTAFEVLFARYQPAVARYVRRMVSDATRAEDITQEIFVSALRRLRTTDTDIVFKPWVYEIAKNACIDQFRRARRTQEVSLHEDADLGPADRGRLATTDEAPEKVIGDRASLTSLRGALDGLSDAHQEILVLRELEGRSYQEIGERLNLSRPSVESTLFRARRSLHKEFAELDSGARCIQVRASVLDGGRPGKRESQRMSSHFAHCAPCRRFALEAGVDAHLLRRPLRERIAAISPAALLLRVRGGGGSAAPASHAAAVGNALSDPSTANWGRAAAAAAAVIVAGLGAGTATHVIHSGGHHSAHSAAAPASSDGGVLGSAARAAGQTGGAKSAPAHTQTAATGRRSSAGRIAPRTSSGHTTPSTVATTASDRQATAPTVTEPPHSGSGQPLAAASKTGVTPALAAAPKTDSGTTPGAPATGVDKTVGAVATAAAAVLDPPAGAGGTSDRSSNPLGNVLRPGA